MSNAIKFGILNAIIGLILGIYIAYSAIGDGYWMLTIGAPTSAFICGFYFWKLMFKKSTENKSGKLVLIGLLTGTVSHYLCWILLNIGMNICYWTTGKCTSSLGEPPAQIWEILIFGIGITGWSLLFYGWITIPSSIGIGFLVSRTKKSMA
ncbi:MAG: hypothetical protein AAF901_11640 [Bacteroidota bacterium]